VTFLLLLSQGFPKMSLVFFEALALWRWAVLGQSIQRYSINTLFQSAKQLSLALA